MTKKQRPQASSAKKLRRQFGGAFGKASPELQRFLARDTDGRAATEERIARRAEDAVERLEGMINSTDAE